MLSIDRRRGSRTYFTSFAFSGGRYEVGWPPRRPSIAVLLIALSALLRPRKPHSDAERAANLRAKDRQRPAHIRIAAVGEVVHGGEKLQAAIDALGRVEIPQTESGRDHRGRPCAGRRIETRMRVDPFAVESSAQIGAKTDARVTLP